MKILGKLHTKKRAVRSVVISAVVAGALSAAALPAWADTTMTSIGNSPGAAADSATASCYFYTNYNATDVLNIWSYVDSNGATMFKATVRCYNN
jgi:hypothetical protein